MRIFVNALSVSAPSGRHVLYGHLRQLSTAASDHEFHVLCLPGELHPTDLDRANIHWITAPFISRNWVLRSWWETNALNRLIAAHRADLYFTPSGTVLPRCDVPQVSLAQNPWCLVPELARSARERLKARIQRRAYLNAFKHAALMVYNSEHMRRLYRHNARGDEGGPSVIAHQAIDDATHKRAAQLRRTVRRDDATILAVSVMAHWKGAETLVRALKMLHRRGTHARLRLVGAWPDRAYECMVRLEIAKLGLGDSVEIVGHLPLDELHRAYAEARVFCLMSRCESFGIPALEAQAFGTPVVGSNTTAMPEICGSGGVYAAPLEPRATADLLDALITDESRWLDLSGKALANAAKYRWSHCSQPLGAMFKLA